MILETQPDNETQLDYETQPDEKTQPDELTQPDDELPTPVETQTGSSNVAVEELDSLTVAQESIPPEDEEGGTGELTFSRQGPRLKADEEKENELTNASKEGEPSSEPFDGDDGVNSSQWD